MMTSNRDKINAQRRYYRLYWKVLGLNKDKWYYGNPQVKERLKLYHLNYYQDNKEYLIAYQKGLAKAGYYKGRYLNELTRAGYLRAAKRARNKKRIKEGWIRKNISWGDKFGKYNGKERARAKKLWKEYKLDYELYRSMLDKQNNLCKICKGQPTKLGWCVDHNHKTNKVRGVLCHKCNSVIGFVYESKEILNNAINYLEEYSQENIINV